MADLVPPMETVAAPVTGALQNGVRKMPPQVVFLLSTSYGGSHFLALQLGSHSRCISIGEFHHFKYRDHEHPDKRCFACASDEDCPLFRGIAGAPVRQLYQHLFANVRESFPGVDTIIDNSKHPRWSRRFLGTDAFESKFIHLLRDPRALIRRWMLFYDSSRRRRILRWRMARRCWHHAGNILRGSDVNVYLWLWWYRNKMTTDYIRRNGLNARIVTYSDLVLEPDRVLGELMAWLGHTYEPTQKAYWQHVHHGTVKPQYMQPPPEGQFAFDQRWKEFLGDEAIREALEHTAIQQYLETVGLRLDGERGLTRKDSA